MFFKTCVAHNYETVPQKAKQSPSLVESAQGICCWSTLQALCIAWKPGRSFAFLSWKNSDKVVQKQVGNVTLKLLQYGHCYNIIWIGLDI